MQAELRQTQRREADALRALAESEACSLSSLHRRRTEVVSQRVGGDRPVPGGFEALVAVLDDPAEQRRVPRTPGAALGEVDAARAALRERQAEVRRAPPEGLGAAVARRDEARQRQVTALREARDAVLRATGSTTLADLDGAITVAAKASAVAEAALATARAAATAEPHLGSRVLPPRKADGEVETGAAAAVAAYREYVRACSSAHMVAATETAVLAVREELHKTALFLPGSGLRPGAAVQVVTTAPMELNCENGGSSSSSAACPADNESSSSAALPPWVPRDGQVVSLADEDVVVRFRDGAVETVPRDRVEEVRGDGAALAALDELVRRAHSTIGAEASFWQGLDQVATLPCSQLLAAGRTELEVRMNIVKALRANRARHTALSKELEDEEEALTPERSRDPAVRALLVAAEAHLDAGDALQDALQAVQRARIRGRPVEPLEEKAAKAKEGAKRADAEVRQAMLGLAEAMRRFPEVGGDPGVLKHLRISLPPELVPLWCMGRTLGHFDTRELLPCASKHRLYCVKEGGKSYAVKEYAVVGGQDGLRVCLHEAALLTRARHPHIAEIVALFTDPEEHGFFIQMPFYEQGSLDKWVADHKPDDHSVRRVLAQVVTALAHLHGLGIVHADIKPGNILMDGRGFARLGDFDVSVDSGTRTSAARAHATMTQVGFTPGFAAPELLRTGASAASDIFALGATIAEVAPKSEERDSLLQRLQAVDPAARPSAQQVLQDAFFAPVFAWARDERRSCCICLEEKIRLEEGIECGRTDGQPHFVCSQCLEQHVEAVVGAELRLRQANEGRVCCPGRPCDAAAYPDVDLAKRLSAAVFHRYTESRLDLLEQRRAAELEGEMQVRLGAELRRLQALDEQQRRVRAVRNHIAEEILTLKCPRCGQAFLDFVGCFALQCSRCPCGFCAWCGADSGGSNAHEHVRNCREKPPGADVFFGTFEQFEAAQRRRRRRLLHQFLPSLDVQTRAAVLHEMRRDLGDLGLVDLVAPVVGVGPMAL